jgi:hypothetical protein
MNRQGDETSSIRAPRVGMLAKVRNRAWEGAVGSSMARRGPAPPFTEYGAAQTLS